MIDATALLDFWFGPRDEWREVWFETHPEFDRALKERFGDLAHSAPTLIGWMETAEGALARVIALDQLPRNLHRGTPAAFAHDGLARQAADHAIRCGRDRELPPLRRMFLYLPFEHSEELVDQERSVALTESLGPDFAEPLDYARRHRDIIARFGRFPHRNAVLGRVSTPEELAFLAQPGSSF